MPYIFTFPWDRLESFRCDSSLQAEHCHEMLLSCQALQKIHVRVFGIKYSPLPTVEIPLPNLVSFSVQLCDQENYDLFFLPLILPALRSLWIYNYDGVAWSHGMYNGLLERSGCSIEHIYLGTIDAETRDVLTLFQRSPSLTSVTFSHNTIITPEILYMIGRGEVGGSLVQLFLKGIHELDPILTMLELRRSVSSSNTGPRGNRLSDSSLKFIETYCTPGEILAHANRIESLRGSGFEISLLKSVEGYFQL
ncbi:hypothetical protein BDZ97DRAFT_1919646 [Flammula alnicola]|nr:hypothetical protein BDZ97DRAFT_1919646 [Flammula alnicola]